MQDCRCLGDAGQWPKIERRKRPELARLHTEIGGEKRASRRQRQRRERRRDGERRETARKRNDHVTGVRRRAFPHIANTPDTHRDIALLLVAGISSPVAFFAARRPLLFLPFVFVPRVWRNVRASSAPTALRSPTEDMEEEANGPLICWWSFSCHVLACDSRRSTSKARREATQRGGRGGKQQQHETDQLQRPAAACSSVQRPAGWVGGLSAGDATLPPFSLLPAEAWGPASKLRQVPARGPAARAVSF